MPDDDIGPEQEWLCPECQEGWGIDFPGQLCEKCGGYNE